MITGTYASPVGHLRYEIGGDALRLLEFGDASDAASLVPSGARAVTDRLDRYFAGDIGALDDIEVEFGARGTPFQRKVWRALRSVPAGATCSYADIAERIGAPLAVRAVGAANGKNPIAIVVPCHRVIGKDGSLTGYGGGLDRKRWLLRHERALPSVVAGASQGELWRER